MATEIKIPQLGESVSEGTIASWLKEQGAFVERDEPVLELETDKITMEVPAPAAGAVSHSASEGDTVSVGDVVGTIDESAEKGGGGTEAAEEKAEKKEKKKEQEQEAEKKERAEKQEQQREAADTGERKKQREEGAPSRETVRQATSTAAMPAPDVRANGAKSVAEGVRATPLARKLASEHGVDLSSVGATGPGGRIREQDVLDAVRQRGEAPADGGDREAAPQRRQTGGAPDAGDRQARRERMSRLRQSVASRLVEAQRTAAMLTTFNEADMTNVMAARSKHKDAFEKAHAVKLGFMSFFVKACVEAARAYPRVNAFIVEGENGPEIEHHDYCDIAIAVGTDKGLVVPVVRNCHTRSFAEIESGILEMANKARDGKLALEDMQGGTFTITNGGIYGSMMSTPILNPPQSGILGMHNIVRRPVEDPENPGSGSVVVRPMMYLALSYDHRIVDGAEAVGFLKRVKECIEDPERMLIGV